MISNNPLPSFALVLVLGWSQLLAANPVSSNQEKPGRTGTAESEEQSDPPPPITFEPDFQDSDFEASRERAWEFRPYLVAVWFCLDGSPALNSNYDEIARGVTRRSELVDPSGWDLSTALAPPRWRQRFLSGIEKPTQIPGIDAIHELAKYDKLIVVCLNNQSDGTKVRVREFDVQTQLWGPLQIRVVSQRQQLAQQIMESINLAFMPLAQIDRIQEIKFEDDQGKPKTKDQVVMRLRAVNACVKAYSIPEQHPKYDAYVKESEQGEFRLVETEPAANETSPVFTNESDRFLPIIRKTDRNGNLVNLIPIDFTFLVVDPEESEGADVRCYIESNRGSPLGQRASRKAQKLAVVIRPPQRPTTLSLVSNDKKRTPMEGFDIYSRRPNQKEGGNEYLGKTDWRGEIEIPPSEIGLRIILVSRGSRRMRRLPIIPGLYDRVESTLPNDETRLYAEGVFRGLENEVLSLVIRRKVMEEEMDSALKAGDQVRAREIFDEYRDLETPQDLKDRMSAEEANLKTQTQDKGELKFINSRFESLRAIVNREQTNSKEMELTKALQELSTSQSAD
ncbi:MAG: hypothetical protein AAF623_09130 [Planctomycetota bacterium]